MKYYLAIFVLLAFCSCNRKPQKVGESETGSKTISLLSCPNEIENMDLMQFYVHPLKLAGMLNAFGEIYYDDTTDFNETKIGMHGTLLPKAAYEELKNFTLANTANIKGIRMFYGYDVEGGTEGLFFIFERVELEYKGDTLDDGVLRVKYKLHQLPGSPEYKVYNFQGSGGWTNLDYTLYNDYITRYKDVVKVKKHDNYYSSLNMISTDPDPAGIIFPLAEIDVLIEQNESFTKLINYNSTVTHIEFMSAAENLPKHPWEYHYKHIVVMKVLVDGVPSEYLSFTGAAANMGSLCPPNCVDLTYLKSTCPEE